jgi:glycosyltransferase involved in cell wall biosynthesis
VARHKGSVAGNVGSVSSGEPDRPRIVFLHFTAPPIVGGVEAVIAEHVRLFSEAGYQTLIVAGRVAEDSGDDSAEIVVIPEMDSENPDYLAVYPSLEAGKIPESFLRLQSAIESGLKRALMPSDVVIAHNILTTHFNLALTAAVHALARANELPHLVCWCHDISRHVNPDRDAPQYHGQPWDLLRTRIPGAVYVAVSSSRQQALASILDCSAAAIEVIPNGVDPVQLLGLSDLGSHLIVEFDLFAVDLLLLMPVRITKVKNIEFALQVAHELKGSGRTLRLIVTGPPDPHVADIPDYLEELIKLRDSLDLHEDVIFVHEGTSRYPSPLMLEPDIVGEFYRISDLILMPSIREGFGMPVLEAGMVDRPVFATTIPVTQDLPEFKYLIERDESAYSVARRINQWAETDAAHRLRREVRSNFTWSRIFSRRIIPLVKRVAHTGRGPSE